MCVLHFGTNILHVPSVNSALSRQLPFYIQRPFFLKLGQYLKLGTEIKILIIMLLSLKIEVNDFECKLGPLNMNSEVFSSLQAGSMGNYWQPKLWS